MNCTIRNATRQDAKAILSLIQELATYEKEPEAVVVTVDDLIRDGFGKNPKFHCFVAEIDKEIVGIALVYTRYSTWKGNVLHLEDLIVSASQRGKGLGGLLLNEVIKYGHNLGVKRISWEVLNWNTPAINFYEHIGANILKDWYVVQMNEQGIQQYLAKRNNKE